MRRRWLCQVHRSRADQLKDNLRQRTVPQFFPLKGDMQVTSPVSESITAQPTESEFLAPVPVPVPVPCEQLNPPVPVLPGLVLPGPVGPPPPVPVPGPIPRPVTRTLFQRTLQHFFPRKP